MINRPYHNFTKEELVSYGTNKVHVTPFANRSARRNFDNNKNLVRQDVVTVKNGVTTTKAVYHKKTTNLPYQYAGVQYSNVAIKHAVIVAKREDNKTA